ncbi:MAG: TIGR03545 family protein, partial [bacterium]
IALDRLQVTNPNDTWKNLFETGRMSFDMELEPLFRKKIIIDDITVADIRIGTKRKTDGRIPKKKTQEAPGWIDKAKESLMKQVASAPVLNLDILKKKINVNSLLASFDVQSLVNIESTKQDADATYNKWQAVVKEFDPTEELNKIDKQINEIRTQEIKGIDDLVLTLDKSKSLYKTLNQLKTDVVTKKNQATNDFKKFTTTLTRVDNWIEEDFNALMKKANLGEFTPKNVGKMLFGQALTVPTIGLLRYVSLARQYMPVVQQFASAGKVEKPPRFAGQNIRFPLRYPRPDFLIEQILISGATSKEDTSQVLHVSGEVKGITSHPRVYGRPLTLELNARLPQSKAYQASGVIDHTTEVPAERFQIKASGVRLGNIDLPERPYLPTQIKAQNGDVSANFNLVADQLDFRLNLIARPVKFAFQDSSAKQDLIAKVTKGVFETIQQLQLSAGVTGSVDNLALKINSNIDNLLAQRIKGVLGESVQIAQAEIRTRLHAVVEPKRQEALALVRDRQNQITSEIAKYETQVNDKLAIVDEKKKKIEEKIAAEKKKGLESVTKKLKGIFKKPKKN